jgi:hypothetical protein
MVRLTLVRASPGSARLCHGTLLATWLSLDAGAASKLRRGGTGLRAGGSDGHPNA